MIKNLKNRELKNEEDPDDICEECFKKDESVLQNLISFTFSINVI